MSEADRDERLMYDVCQGKSEALETLIKRHATALLTYLVRMTGDHHLGEELFQEVFYAVWSKRAQYQYPRPFRAGLYAIASNQCWAAFRKARHVPVTLAEELVPVGTDCSPVETAIATEHAAAVVAAVALLPVQQRSVVVLRMWQQLTYDEIAEVLDTPAGTVRDTHHGLCALRKYLELRLHWTD